MSTAETRLYITFLTGAAVIGSIIFYSLYTAAQQRRKLIRVQRKYFLNELEILERERQRIGRELHDQMGTGLVVVKNLLENVKGSIETREAGNIERASDIIQGMVDQVGSIVHNLRPKMLDMKGLEFVLHHFADSINKGGKIEFRFRYSLDRQLHSPSDIHLYRVIQEIVQNTLKHAEARLLEIEIKDVNGMLYLVSRDDGKGFDLEAVQKTSSGLGLSSIQSRIIMLGGELRCITAPGKGTEYFCTIPI
jgi:signal transduction histidine kinase